MPSLWHDSANELFRENPELAGHILRDLMGVDLPPELPLSLAPGDFTDRPSRDLIADTVIVAGSAEHPARGIIVEIQQNRDKDKRRQWPRYAAAMWLRHDCPVDLLVICPDEATARWYAEPIATKLDGYMHQPKVLLPTWIPAMTDAEQVAADPLMAVLSVAYHGQAPGVAEAFVAGMASLGAELGKNYYDCGIRMSPAEVCQILEVLVTTTYKKPYSEFLKRAYGEGLEEGLVMGERDKILLTLELRGLEVDDSQRDRITSCADLGQLREWANTARTAAAIDDVFG
jgi:hypothetical protein